MKTTRRILLQLLAATPLYRLLPKGALQQSVAEADLEPAARDLAHHVDEEVLRRATVEQAVAANEFEIKRAQAVAYLRDLLPERDKAIFRRRIARDPTGWPHHDMWHFRGGMNVRNALRTGGFGETELGVENLDDHYIGIVEDAVS